MQGYLFFCFVHGLSLKRLLYGRIKLFLAHVGCIKVTLEIIMMNTKSLVVEAFLILFLLMIFDSEHVNDWLFFKTSLVILPYIYFIVSLLFLVRKNQLDGKFILSLIFYPKRALSLVENQFWQKHTYSEIDPPYNEYNMDVDVLRNIYSVFQILLLFVPGCILLYTSGGLALK